MPQNETQGMIVGGGGLFRSMVWSIGDLKNMRKRAIRGDHHALQALNITRYLLLDLDRKRIAGTPVFCICLEHITQERPASGIIALVPHAEDNVRASAISSLICDPCLDQELTEPGITFRKMLKVLADDGFKLQECAATSIHSPGHA